MNYAFSFYLITFYKGKCLIEMNKTYVNLPLIRLFAIEDKILTNINLILDNGNYIFKILKKLFQYFFKQQILKKIS